MGRSKKSWYARNEKNRITKEYVDNYCKITDRELRLLKIIHERKMVRRDLLEIISSDYRDLGSNRTRILNRSLDKLFQNLCIDKIHEKQDFKKGNKPMIVALDKAGSILLDVKHKSRIKRTKTIVNGELIYIREIPNSFAHSHGINLIECQSILYCDKNNITITEWSIEKPIRFIYGMSEVFLIPDVRFCLKSNTDDFKDIYGYIEYDTGSENIRHKKPKIIIEKIDKYSKVFNSGYWKSFTDKLPILIFVTEDKKRIKFFNDLCKEKGVFGIGTYSKNYPQVFDRIVETLKRS